MKNPLEVVASMGIIPLLDGLTPAQSGPVAQAMVAGDLSAVAIPASACLPLVTAMKAVTPAMTVAVCGVADRTAADLAVGAGADLVFLSTFQPDLIAHCQSAGLCAVPTVTTAVEMHQGIALGLSVFYCDGAIFDTFLPLPDGISCIVGGAMTGDALDAYLRSEYVLAVCGADFIPSSAITAQDWSAVTAAAVSTMDRSLGLVLGHIGLNHESEEEALTIATLFGKLFRIPVKVGNSSIFAGKAVECMKKPSYGTRGHIGFGTNSVHRARGHFDRLGVAVLEESYTYNAKGRPGRFFLTEEVCGFALHVMQR